MSKAKADARARAAFLAGQQQAMQQAVMHAPSVKVVGPVRNTMLPWTAGLTLAKALVAAEYYGMKDPSEILLVRDGQATRFDPSQLLNGEDIPLLPQDVIQINQ